MGIIKDIRKTPRLKEEVEAARNDYIGATRNTPLSSILWSKIPYLSPSDLVKIRVKKQEKYEVAKNALIDELYNQKIKTEFSEKPSERGSLSQLKNDIAEEVQLKEAELYKQAINNYIDQPDLQKVMFEQTVPGTEFSEETGLEYLRGLLLKAKYKTREFFGDKDTVIPDNTFSSLSKERKLVVSRLTPIYSEGITPREKKVTTNNTDQPKFTRESPEVIDYAKEVVSEELSNIFKEAFFVQGGLNSKHWKDPIVGFANKKIFDIMNVDLEPTFKSNFSKGIENPHAVEKMQDYIQSTIDRTGVDVQRDELIIDYLIRANTEIIT